MPLRPDATTSLNNWDFHNHHVQAELLGGEFISAETTLIAAGPPRLTDVSGGGAIDTDATFEAAAAGGLYTNGEKRVWEALGLSTDPGKEYDVVLGLTAAADAAGTVLVRVYVVR